MGVDYRYRVGFYYIDNGRIIYLWDGENLERIHDGHPEWQPRIYGELFERLSVFRESWWFEEI